MLLLLLSLIAAAVGSHGEASAALQLRLTAPARILVGEATKVTVEWTATRQTFVVPAEAEIWLDSGGRFQRYQETSLGAAWTVDFDQALKAGETTVSEHILAVTGYPDASPFVLAFPHAGRYRVRVQYKGATSNVVTIVAIEPNGRDAELLKQLRRRPELLSQWGTMPEFGAGTLEGLLSEYHGSRYLARPQILWWMKQLEEARMADRELAIAPREGKVAELLDVISGEPLEGTSFEEDRLALLAEAATAMGDRQKAREWYDAVLAKYPSGAVATKARQWIAAEKAMAREEAATKQDH
jgi:hypothetical protein